MTQPANRSTTGTSRIGRWVVLLCGVVLGVSVLRYVYYDVAVVEAYVRLR